VEQDSYHPVPWQQCGVDDKRETFHMSDSETLLIQHLQKTNSYLLRWEYYRSEVLRMILGKFQPLMRLYH
jgi:hypothetical protein